MKNKSLNVVYSIVIFVVSVGSVLYWVGPASFLFAWVLHLMLMMVTLATTQLISPALTSPYYNAKRWEQEGRIYRWIGINGFRKLLVWVGWEKHNKPTVPVKKSVDALKHLEHMSRQSEIGHVVIFFIVLAIAGVISFYRGIESTFWLHFLNILLNAYPAALQRYNRPRYRKTFQKLADRKVSTETSLAFGSPVTSN
jgi:hypothetical protein